MYIGLLHTHNLFRWLVFFALILALIFSIIGWAGNKSWTKRNRIAGLALTISMDIQFLLGLVLYAFVSPLTKAAFADFGAAMKNSELRFYAVEHILLMLIALIFVHIGWSKAKNATESRKKHRAATIWFGSAFLLVIAGIPWDRALI